eukprot:6213981-Pyramimonas_sp.AAC.3
MVGLGLRSTSETDERPNIEPLQTYLTPPERGSPPAGVHQRCGSAAQHGAGGGAGGAAAPGRGGDAGGVRGGAN